VWVQHSDLDATDEEQGIVRGSDGWRIVPELDPRPDEPLIEKNYGDSFEATSLEDVLTGLGVGRVVVAGAQTDACIRSTLHGALVRGYDTTLVSDAHTTEDMTRWGAPPPEQVIAHTNLYWRYQTAPGRTAGTVETKDVDFGLA
jgi:nicotinamidase-related amidase